MGKEDTIIVGTTVFLVNKVDNVRRLCRGVVDSIDCHSGKHAHVQWDSPVQCASYKPLTILTTSAVVAISVRNDLDPAEIARIIDDAQARGLLQSA